MRTFVFFLAFLATGCNNPYDEECPDTGTLVDDTDTDTDVDTDVDTDDDTDLGECELSEVQCSNWGDDAFGLAPLGVGEDVAVQLVNGCWLFGAGTCDDIVSTYGSFESFRDSVSPGTTSDVAGCWQICW